MSLKESLSAPEEEVQDSILPQIEECIDQARNRLQDGLVSSATRQSYEGMFEEYRRDKNLDYAKSIVPLIDDMLEKAENSRSRLTTALDEAVAKGWMSKMDRQQGLEWFDRPHILEYQRTKWINEKLEKHIARRRKVAEDREKLLTRFAIHNLTAADDPLIAQVLNQHAFMALDYQERNALVHRADALVLAITRGKKQLFNELSGRLEAAYRSQERCIPKGKAAQWLKETFTTEDPKAYFSSVIVPRIAVWQELRGEFDAVAQELSTVSLPGFPRPTLDKFLGWSIAQCETYLAEARNRMAGQSDAEQESEKQLQKGVSAVRSSMDLKDWEGAQEQLDVLALEHSDDKRVQTMAAYLQTHRDDEAEKKKVEPPTEEVQQEIDEILRDIHPSLRHLYKDAFGRGGSALRRVADHMKYAVDLEQTEQLKTEKKAAVFDLEEEEGNQTVEVVEDVRMLAVASDEPSQERALDIMEQNDAYFEGSEHRGILSTDPFAAKQQESLVRGGVNVRLLQLQRQLEKRGERFALAA